MEGKFGIAHRLRQCLYLSVLLTAVLYGEKPAIGGAIRTTPAWTEDFNAGTSRWNVYSGPFSTNTYTIFDRSHASTGLSGTMSVLNLAITKTGTQPICTSGGVDTQFSYTQQYGKWEVRAKLAPGYGAWTYIGLFPADPAQWPPEIDFAEVIGKQPQQVFLTQHYKRQGKVAIDQYMHASGLTNWTAGFHTYAVEWIPGKLTYLIDGIKVAEQLDRAGKQKLKLAIGTACGAPGSWADHPDRASLNGFTAPLPTSAQIDWVKIYPYLP
jgi:beta-glucanase (GH16 family)